MGTADGEERAAREAREFAREMLTKITTAFGRIMREED